METKKVKNVWFRHNGNTLCYYAESISFDRSQCYIQIPGDNENKFSLMKDGITFNDSIDGKKITIKVSMENISGIEF